MKTFDLEHMTRGLVSLIVVLLPTVGMAQQLRDDQVVQILFDGGIVTLAVPAEPDSSELNEMATTVEAASVDTAYERGVEPSPDPWTVGTSSALFSRPSLSQAFTFSAEATKGGGNYSVSASAEKLAPANRFLKGLQVIGGYSADSQSASLGLKWSLSFQKDIRSFSATEKTAIFNAGRVSFNSCQDDVLSTLASEKASLCTGLPESDCKKQITSAFKESILKCGHEEVEAQTEIYKEKRPVRPNISAGASVSYGFQDYRWSKVASNVSMELPVYDVSLIVNGDFESARGEDGLRHPNLGGSLTLSYVIPKSITPKFLEERLRAEFTGKVLECLESCGEESSTVRFGPTLSFALQDDKDTLLGVSFNWNGKGKFLSDAFLGLSLSHSIGALGSD
jgi:hypothetical protein